MNIKQGHGMHSEGNTDQDCIPSTAPDLGNAPVSAPPALRVRQPWGRLLKAVLDLAGEQAELVCHVEHDWASATFSGSRHAITLGFGGADAAEAGEAFVVAFPDHEFFIPRYLVADAQVTGVDEALLPERRLVVQVELWLLERA
jgi:hypothetical protein